MNKLLLGICALLLFSCDNQQQPENSSANTQSTSSTSSSPTEYVMDTHSYSKPKDAVVKHLELDIEVDFASKKIRGFASYQIENNGSTKIVFDSKDLIIKSIVIGKNAQETTFDLSKSDPVFGSALTVDIKKHTEMLTIEYETSENAEALQWLSPQQTAGKQHPFLFTQSQAILARTWIPCQDSPGIRFTYNAKVNVPAQLMALMSATNPTVKNETGVYTFKMEQAIPSYLMALAVGDVKFQSVGEHTGVYAEPSTLPNCANELEDMEKMLVAAENLYGPYQWERYDVIVLPPSFPFGGMENPRLTFATPTIIAGDKSLTSLIAHELAHSWSGNLVTNATWDDFWLNEGFTVYFEHRIMEAVYGKDYSEMLALLSYQSLEQEVEEILKDTEHNDTWLKLDLEGRNPDDGLTAIAYDKGYYFLRLLEEEAGREKFDTFLKGYFKKHAFTSMTTERFIEYLNAELIDKHQLAVNIDEWIYGPGIPESIIPASSNRFETVNNELTAYLDGIKSADEISSKEWSTHEWLHFLRSIPENISLEELSEIDNAFALTQSKNREIQAIWYQRCIEQGYDAIEEELEAFLVEVGRRKFLQPLYAALIKTRQGKKQALSIYKKARKNYHSVSYNTIDQMLGYKPKKK